MTVVAISELTFNETLSGWHRIKEAQVCFSETELVRKWQMSRQNRQVFESKGVPTDPKTQKHCL